MTRIPTDAGTRTRRSPADRTGDSPLHGYRGEEASAPTMGVPAGLTIAISREAGSRGASIAKRGRKARLGGL